MGGGGQTKLVHLFSGGVQLGALRELGCLVRLQTVV